MHHDTKLKSSQTGYFNMTNLQKLRDAIMSIWTKKTVKKLHCWLLSQDIQDIWKYDTNMNMRQNYRMSHFIIVWFNSYML